MGGGGSSNGGGGGSNGGGGSCSGVSLGLVWRRQLEKLNQYGGGSLCGCLWEQCVLQQCHQGRAQDLVAESTLVDVKSA